MSKHVPRIVAVLPRGETLRNFVYSGTLDQVAGSVDLTVMSVLPSAELSALLSSRFDDVRELAPIAERVAVTRLRELLDVAHGRWLWSEAAQSRWRVRDSEATTPALRLKRMVKKAACYPLANRAGIRLLERAERAASKWLRTTREYLELFETLRPSLVFNASHVHSPHAIQATQAAQWLGIPTATFIFSWDNLTSQGRIIPSYDHYLVWNDDLRAQLLDIYRSVRPEQVSVTGTPQFDFHFRPEFRLTREDFCRKVGADPSRPIVFYSTGMANPMFGEPRIVEGIADIVAGLDQFGPPQLLVRVYPKDRTGRFDDLKQRRPDILFPEVPWEPAWLTPKPEDSALLTNTLRHAAVGINAASTISLELCMFAKPVVNVGYNPPGMNIWPWDYGRFYTFEHYRPVVESGAVAVARSESQLREMLVDALRAPDARAPQQRALMSRMFGSTLDGQSGARVAECLVALAGGPSTGAGRPLRTEIAC
ncbi:MAG: hypothetical protein GEU82_02390 [Luteitalea sp.]|nr:hypothetical protein [Luteitalea sp.]